MNGKEVRTETDNVFVIHTPKLIDQTNEVETHYELTRRYPVLDEIQQINESRAKALSQQDKTIKQRHAQETKQRQKRDVSLASFLPPEEIPSSLEEFQTVPHLPPVAQYLTNTCWSYAATSLLESEVLRKTGQKIKLSEMNTVYYEYLDKGARYIAERGESHFAEGSEINAIFPILKKHGVVPAASFQGTIEPDKRHNHVTLISELKGILAHAKKAALWNTETIGGFFKVVLEKYLGPIPGNIMFDGVQYEPTAFVTDVLKIHPDEYVQFMSTLRVPFYTSGELEVVDNWWHCEDYLNLPLDLFYEGIIAAIKKGYSVGVALDVSEPGIDRKNDVMFIPPYDAHQQMINQLSREYRINNGSTADDHAAHLVGYLRKGEHDWFLTKDSAQGARLGRFKGYYFIRGDYVRLKVLAFYVHQDAVSDLLAKRPSETDRRQSNKLSATNKTPLNRHTRGPFI